jgi:cation diffusion facilitator family transporter
MATGGSKFVIFASIAANLLIAIMKFIASAFTGSSAMLSEGIHSVIDTSNGLLLLFGIKQSKKAPDKLHPFGHGKEIYFWSFIVSILVFSLGGGVAIYEGIHKLLYPSGEMDHSNVIWNYGVLLGAVVFEGASLIIALKDFRKVHPTGFKSALEESKDAASVAIIIENGAAVVGLVIALIGVTLAFYLNDPVYDAMASILIGILLVYVAYFMAKETKHLLIGETASDNDLKMINNILDDYKQIEFFGNIRTMHLGPDEVMTGMEVNFKDNIPVGELEKIVKDIKEKIRKNNPKFTHIYVESDSIRKSTYN